jgi:ribonuclease P protein component
MESFSFSEKDRIVRRADFIDVSLHGSRYYTRNFVVILKQNRRDATRLGITVSRRVGNSVKRNRIKRSIREFFRLSKQQIPKGYDIVVIASKEIDTCTSLKVQEELGDLLLRNHALFS